MSERVERRNGERRQSERRKAKGVRPHHLPDRRNRSRRRWTSRRAGWSPAGGRQNQHCQRGGATV